MDLVHTKGISGHCDSTELAVIVKYKYKLTDIGREFEPVLESIKVWGNKYIQYLHDKNA